MTIQIKHVVTGREVVFDAFLKSFNDSYKSEWNSQKVMGRMDPVATFQRTSRVISFSFVVPSYNLIGAITTQAEIRKLSTFLYPVYKEPKTTSKPISSNNAEIKININANDKVGELYKAQGAATTLEQQLTLRKNVAIMSSSPIVSIKFLNFIEDSVGGALFGYLDGLKINPQVDDGFFIDDEGAFPKTYLVDLNFNVIHSEPLGWNYDNGTRGGPWNVYPPEKEERLAEAAIAAANEEKFDFEIGAPTITSAESFDFTEEDAAQLVSEGQPPRETFASRIPPAQINVSAPETRLPTPKLNTGSKKMAVVPTLPDSTSTEPKHGTTIGPNATNKPTTETRG